MARSYDLKIVTLAIGGIPIVGGYSDDGGIEFEWNAGPYTEQVGATGDYTFAKTNDRGLKATITVRQSSLAYRLLHQLQAAQENVVGAIPPLPFLMRDPISGTRVASQDAVFLTRAAPTMNKEASDRVFEIRLPSPQVEGAPLITV